MRNNNFYRDCNSNSEKKYYTDMLGMLGSLSNLFSNNTKPYLDSRIVENLFCRCLNAINLSRSDITADAKKNKTGIGIKTWIDSDCQKIAEFNKNNSLYSKRDDLDEKIRIISGLRNDRINFTLRTQNINHMVYHCVKRFEGKICIYETPLQEIDIDKIKNIVHKGSTIKFEDDRNRYSFNISKSTLYKYFDDMDLLAEMPVEIIQDPFQELEKFFFKVEDAHYDKCPVVETVYLPLYSVRGGQKVVNEKSGLNQRFAGGRKRDIYEMYIPIPSEFNKLHRKFFPARDVSFELLLPNGEVVSAKVCQDNDKALMSNPNSALGKWIIDDVFEINPDEIITYEMMDRYGIDSVMIEKVWDLEIDKRYYRINFSKINSYEKFMGRVLDL